MSDHRGGARAAGRPTPSAPARPRGTSTCWRGRRARGRSRAPPGAPRPRRLRGRRQAGCAPRRCGAGRAAAAGTRPSAALIPAWSRSRLNSPGAPVVVQPGAAGRDEHGVAAALAAGSVAAAQIAAQRGCRAVVKRQLARLAELGVADEEHLRPRSRRRCGRARSPRRSASRSPPATRSASGRSPPGARVLRLAVAFKQRGELALGVDVGGGARAAGRISPFARHLAGGVDRLQVGGKAAHR